MKKFSRWDVVGERFLPGALSEQQLAELPRLPYLDLDELEASCAPGSVGHTVAIHMKKCGLNPNIFEPYYYAGLAHTSQGNFERAVDMYRKAMQINPTDYQPVIFLAQAYASLGRSKEERSARKASIELLERHIRMNPDDTRALCLAASQLHAVGESGRGKSMAEEALARATAHFVHCIETGTQPLTDGAAGLRVVRVLEAAQRSLADEGRRVYLDFVDDACTQTAYYEQQLLEALTLG